MTTVGTDHSFPASQVLQLVELVQRWKIGADELLAHTGLTEATLEEPRARVPLATLMLLTRRARALTGEPGIGFYLGLQKRLSKYGHVGFAAANAGTMREAIELAVKFSPILTTAITLRLLEHGEIATLIADEHADLGDMHDVATFSFLVGWRQISNALTGKELALGRSIEVSHPEPAYYKRFAHLLPNVQFDRPLTQIVFDARALDRKLVAADRSAMRLAREVCERELQALGFQRTFTGSVTALILRADGSGIRSLEEVASSLHVSPRTLKRRLAAEDTSFSTLAEQQRKELALLLLRAPELSLDTIAERLGYSSSANFVRGFRRWLGTTPAAYRRDEIAPKR